MRRCLLLFLGFCVAGLGWARADSLRASKPEVRTQVVGTIELQLEAFRNEDLTTAYAYASNALRAQKPLPVFAAIMAENYPEIWKNVRAEFGIVRDNGTTAKVRVHVFGQTGDTSYDYTLLKEGGRWRIHTILRHTSVKDDKV